MQGSRTRADDPAVKFLFNPRELGCWATLLELAWTGELKLVTATVCAAHAEAAMVED